MMKKIIAICSLILISAVSLKAGGDQTLEEFKKQLKGVGLEFIIPFNFEPTPVIDNEDVLYYYAVKHKKEKIEIRYSIFPYVKGVKEPDNVIVGSDNYHKDFTYSIVANIAGDDKNIETFKYIDEDVVKKSFKADVGYLAVVKPESGFGKGFKKAMIVGLYKSGFGFSYHTILYNEDKNDENILAQFYSIRFKDKK